MFNYRLDFRKKIFIFPFMRNALVETFFHSRVSRIISFVRCVGRDDLFAGANKTNAV